MSRSLVLRDALPQSAVSATQSPVPVIRDATAEDARAVAQIRIGSLSVALNTLLPASVLASIRAGERERFTSCMRWERMFVCQVDDDVVGWVSACPSSDIDLADAVEISGLHVRPSKWRQGYGSSLLLRVLSEACAVGAGVVAVWIPDGYSAAKSFYQMRGFVRDGSRKTIAMADGVMMAGRYRMLL